MMYDINVGEKKEFFILPHFHLHIFLRFSLFMIIVVLGTQRMRGRLVAGNKSKYKCGLRKEGAKALLLCRLCILRQPKDLSAPASRMLPSYSYTVRCGRVVFSDAD